MKQAYHVILVLILTIVGLICVYTMLDNTNCVEHSYSDEDNKKIISKVKLSLLDLFKRFKFNTKTQSWKCSSSSKMATNVANRVSHILYSMYPNFKDISSEIDELHVTMKKIEPNKMPNETDLGKSICIKLGILSAIVSAAVAEECTCLFETIAPTINSLKQSQEPLPEPLSKPNLIDTPVNKKKHNNQPSKSIARSTLVPNKVELKQMHNDVKMSGTPRPFNFRNFP